MNRGREYVHTQLLLRHYTTEFVTRMETPLVQVDTAMGSFQVELYYRHAPQACKNFQELAKKGYYDGTIVSHMIRSSSLAQITAHA